MTLSDLLLMHLADFLSLTYLWTESMCKIAKHVRSPSTRGP